MKRSGIVSLPGLAALGLTLVGLALFLNGELAAEPRTEPPAKAEPKANPEKTRGEPKIEGKQGRHALLVGCTEYPNLDKSFWLAGPGNDVHLMRSVLVEKFAFPPENITTLCDELAKTKKDDKLYPTRANIKRELERLAAKAVAGDKVVILMGGHGSEQPEGPNPANPTASGLDVIFLPRDVGKWDGDKGSVENAIIHFEMGNWLEAIQKKKAAVWLIVDACHSGGMMRAVPDEGKEKLRDVKPEAGLGIPKKALEEAQARAAKRGAGTRGGPAEEKAGGSISKLGGVVGTYAAQHIEVTLEREMPPKAKDAKPYGLLTYTLCQVLIQASSNTDKPITYREVGKRIQNQYTTWGRSFPTPQMEGEDSDREVLGEKEWPNRSAITLVKEEASLKVNGGALRGLTRGSILEVRSPPGQGDKVLGHVLIKEVRTLESDVETCTPDGTPKALADLPEGGACKVVFVDYGDQQLRLSVDPALAPENRKALLAQLAGLGGEKSLVRLVENAAEADWIVRPTKNEKILLLPVAGLAKEPEENNSPFRGPTGGLDLKPWLEEQMGKIAKAENLKKMAADPGATGDFAPKLQINIRRAKDKYDKKGTYPVVLPNTNITFFTGDFVVFEVSNPGRVPVDFTLLYLDSDYAISSLFPTRRNEINRLFPGEKITIDPPAAVNPKPATATAGLEYLVVIGVRGSGEKTDFRCLEQTGIPRNVPKPAEAARKIASALGQAGGLGTLVQASWVAETMHQACVKKGMESALGQMFKKAMFNTGTARGMAAAETEEYTMQLFTWQIKKDKRPAAKANE